MAEIVGEIRMEAGRRRRCRHHLVPDSCDLWLCEFQSLLSPLPSQMELRFARDFEIAVD